MTTKNDIEKVLWSACDSFRNKIDSSRYKDYILEQLPYSSSSICVLVASRLISNYLLITPGFSATHWYAPITVIHRKAYNLTNPSS